jgi:DNA repair photolyase
LKKNDYNAPRGTRLQPKNRFIGSFYEKCDEYEEQKKNQNTTFINDDSQSIITYNDSPDIGYDASLNPYRGCEHGCVYCYARPTHEYFGLSCGLDFETRIFVKNKAPELLKKEISSPNYKPSVLALSGVTDPYQPAEQQFNITRRCLETLVQFRHPVCIVTKNALVLRDIDLLKHLSKYNAVSVSISISTLDSKLKMILEPRTTLPEMRLDTVEKLSAAGIPTSVLVSPVIPGLTDHEIPMIIKAAAQAGATAAFYSILRLPYGVADLFEDWLQRWFPDRKEKILNRIRSLHNGKVYDPRFFRRLTGCGIWADQIRRLFEVSCRKFNLKQRHIDLSCSEFKKVFPQQMNLF